MEVFMKISLVTAYLLSCLFFSVGSFAASEVQSVVDTKEQSQTSEKSSRRKKVMMCHECGKAETECECEGEGHGVDNSEHEGH